MRDYPAFFLVWIGCLFGAIAPAIADPATRPASGFLTGADISMLPRLEEHGVKYGIDGKGEDAIRILRNTGCNVFRVRLFVNPDPGSKGAIQDLSYALALARRIKASGAALVLDLHYSDTWADPGHQRIPTAWKDQNIDQLEKTVERYTADVIARFKRDNALPDFVQIGNEINPGIMAPVGKIDWKTDASWNQVVRLLKAGIDGVRRSLGPTDRTRCIIHIAGGNSPDEPLYWFKKLRDHGLVPDVIGLSHYPWEHGTLESLQKRLGILAGEFDREIMVVETAYPSTPQGFVWQPSGRTEDKVEFGISRQAQLRWWKQIRKTVENTPGNHGLGVIWWYPEIPQQPGNWLDGSTSWFDTKGEYRLRVNSTE